ncbi:hypothetical protein EC973_006155, partial [Apophysomyces ossiformis]
MRVLHGIGLTRTGLSRLLACRIYQQFVRPCLENGLAISIFSAKDVKLLETVQNNCLRMIYSGHCTLSTKAMQHIAKLPAMTDHISILQE